MTAPDDMTLVTPLRAKDGMTLPDFYDITTKYQGVITPAGERGVAVADVIRRVGARSQLAPEVSALFQPVSSA